MFYHSPEKKEGGVYGFKIRNKCNFEFGEKSSKLFFMNLK